MTTNLDLHSTLTTTQPQARTVAVVTGGSRGLGRAIVAALAHRGWSVVTDARNSADLQAMVRSIASPHVRAIAGDLTDSWHRAAIAEAAIALGPVRLLVNNASTLGLSPLPALRDYPVEALRDVYDANLLAPLALTQALLPALSDADGVIVNISSDAAVEAYEGWGGYGPSKAALDQLTAILAAEEPGVAVYAFDPGDMRTEMHQLAFPGEDISDRPEPSTVVPALLRLLDERPRGVRWRVGDLAAATREEVAS